MYIKPTINFHFLCEGRTYAEHDRTRAQFQDIYAEFLAAEKALTGHVLDIGCGHGTNPTIEKIKHKLMHVDGVDPFPTQTPHPLIKKRWVCSLENIPVADATFDMAYSYNVVEHVTNIDTFLTKTVQLIKPGGVYWSMSPNRHHPFAIFVRLSQMLGIKRLYRATIAPPWRTTTLLITGSAVHRQC
jgi:2-polyprenyl-3-methyl-5-hydroxy-6-metoxy-1,4-benzoquinol methylase